MRKRLYGDQNYEEWFDDVSEGKNETRIKRALSRKRSELMPTKKPSLGALAVLDFDHTARSSK